MLFHDRAKSIEVPVLLGMIMSAAAKPSILFADVLLWTTQIWEARIIPHGP